MTGNLKTMKIDLPVLDESADEKYHRQHKETTGKDGEIVRLAGCGSSEHVWRKDAHLMFPTTPVDELERRSVLRLPIRAITDPKGLEGAGDGALRPGVYELKAGG